MRIYLFKMIRLKDDLKTKHDLKYCGGRLFFVPF
jgi:hypothetical protein